MEERLKNSIKKIDNVGVVVDKITNILIVVSLSCMVINIGSSVFARYVLNNSISWSEELARYLMIWFGFFGMALALKKDEHVNITVFINMIKKDYGKIIISYIVYFIVVYFLIIVLIYSFNHLSTLRGQVSPVMQLPMSIPYLSVTVGVSIIMFQCVRKLIIKTLKLLIS
jgi:TRAP-type C4-dicarboxylate transport system permease small subunit